MMLPMIMQSNVQFASHEYISHKIIARARRIAELVRLAMILQSNVH